MKSRKMKIKYRLEKQQIGNKKLRSKRMITNLIDAVIELLEMQNPLLGEDELESEVNRVAFGKLEEVGVSNDLDVTLLMSIDEAAKDETVHLDEDERKEREAEVLKNAEIARMINLKYVRMIREQESLSDAAFILVEDLVDAIATDISERKEKKEKLMKEAEETGHVEHEIHDKCIQGEYISHYDLDEFERWLKSQQILQERTKKNKIRKRRAQLKKLFKRALAVDLFDNEIVKVLDKTMEISKEKEKELERLVREKVALKQREEEAACKKEADEALRLRAEEAVKWAAELNIQTKVAHLLHKGSLPREDDVIDLERALRTANETHERDKIASEEIPALLKNAEQLFQNLSASEQQEHSQKYHKYINDAKKMDRPHKIKKNLRWLVNKMSKRK